MGKRAAQKRDLRRTRKKRQHVHDTSEQRGTAELPELSSLDEVPSFSELSYSARQAEAFEKICEQAEALGTPREELVIGCVVRLDRGFPAVLSKTSLFRAEFATRLTKAGLDAGIPARAAVGDWVCARLPHGHDMGLIEGILPRENDIARWRGSSRGERQTLAANIDIVLVVQQLSDRPVSCNRIARSAVVAADCGARFALILTKVDRATSQSLSRDISCIREVLEDTCPLVLTADPQKPNAEQAQKAASELGLPWGLEEVRALVPAGTVGIVLGESGAGKSSLLNRLLGRETLATGTVRTSDDSGRHTTVARRMVSLPHAGIIVDEPGLRSLPLVGHERGLELVFPEIAEASLNCRFRDCTHTHEPGCVVRKLVDEGVLPQTRLEVYLALAQEMRASANSLDPDIVL